MSHHITKQLEDLITCGLRNIGNNPAYDADERKLAWDFADALDNDTYLMETADAPPEPKQAGEKFTTMPLIDVTAPDPDALLYLTPDDYRYPEQAERAFGILKTIRLARRIEDSDRPSDAQEVWEVINTDIAQFFEDYAPPEPKQFHSGWSVPGHEADFTCAGTWLQCWEHLDAELRARDDERRVGCNQALVHEARGALASALAYGAGTECWVKCDREAFWIAELPS